jgi:hypothetical protein
MNADVTVQLHSGKWNVMVTTGDEQEGIWEEGPQHVPVYYPFIRQGCLVFELGTSREWSLIHYRCEIPLNGVKQILCKRQNV